MFRLNSFIHCFSQGFSLALLLLINSSIFTGTVGLFSSISAKGWGSPSFSLPDFGEFADFADLEDLGDLDDIYDGELGGELGGLLLLLDSLIVSFLSVLSSLITIGCS